jgi:cation-transporting ATPase I
VDHDRRAPHPTDRAIHHALAEVAHEGLGDQRDGWVRLAELPFEPGRAWHLTLGQLDDDRLLSVKGAPEAVLARSTSWRRGTTDVALAEPDRVALSDHIDVLAGRGLRVLAVGERRVEGVADPDTSFCDDEVRDLTLLGFVGLRDPIRPTAAAAVDGARRAGVDVIMITGDHPSTARGVAVEVGLDGGRVLTGGEIDDLDDEELAASLRHTDVCARVTPAHKVRIVQAMQHHGRVVAMTGDGSNDAPAIRLAHVGIALGTRATPAAREAADLTVLDDHIETIVDAIGEGRTMWASVRDAVAVLAGGNLGEIMFILGGSLVAGVPPLGARQLLLVNLLTDVAPALAIAVRPPADHDIESLLREGPDRALASVRARSPS